MLFFKQIGTLLLAGVFFIGCDNPTDSSKKSDITTPALHVTNSNFIVSNFNAAKPFSTTNYVTAVAQVKYTGSSPLKFVEVFATFKTSSGEVLFKDSTYLYNETVVNVSSTGSDIYSNAFVSPEYSNAYYMFIDEVTFDPTEIASVDFTFEGDQFTPLEPAPKVVLSGSVYSSGETMCQNIVNNGTETAKIGSCVFILQNSSGVSYEFDFPDAYVKQGAGYVESEILGGSKEGRLAADETTPSFESKPLTVKKTLLDWDLQSVVAKKSIKTAASPEERKLLILEMRDEMLKAYQNQ